MILGKSLSKSLGMSLGKSFAGGDVPPVVYHTVTFSCTHGTVIAKVDGVEIQTGAQVEHGKTVVFTITPDSGYQYTGTNPETVVVTSAVTKSYECTPAVAWTGLKFTSDGTNTVWLYGEGAWLMDDNEDVTPNLNISHNCEYSLNGGITWVTMPSNPGVAVSFTGTMYVRGNNPAGWGDDTHAPSFRVGGSGHVSVAGNIFSLLDNGAGTITTMPSNSCIPYMFGTKASWGLSYNTCITDASGLVLPDASQIYSFGCLFQNCTGLVNASFTLPTTLGRASCYYMFQDCSSLVNAPSLPATTLAINCYAQMFYNCTKLAGPINISATSPYSSGESACPAMFYNTGTQRVGTNRIINVGGNVADWNSTNCGIDSTYWTVVTPTEELEDE